MNGRYMIILIVVLVAVGAVLLFSSLKMTSAGSNGNTVQANPQNNNQATQNVENNQTGTSNSKATNSKSIQNSSSNTPKTRSTCQIPNTVSQNPSTTPNERGNGGDCGCD